MNIATLDDKDQQQAGFEFVGVEVLGGGDNRDVQFDVTDATAPIQIHWAKPMTVDPRTNTFKESTVPSPSVAICLAHPSMQQGSATLNGRCVSDTHSLHQAIVHAFNIARIKAQIIRIVNTNPRTLDDLRRPKYKYDVAQMKPLINNVFRTGVAALGGLEDGKERELESSGSTFTFQRTGNSPDAEALKKALPDPTHDHEGRAFRVAIFREFKLVDERGHPIPVDGVEIGDIVAVAETVNGDINPEAEMWATIAHELGHAAWQLKDVQEHNTLMYAGGHGRWNINDIDLWFHDQAKEYEDGKENQWLKIDSRGLNLKKP